jgi:hypothetical protein
VKYAFSLLGLLLVLWAQPAGAAKVFEDKEKGIVVNVGVLAQPWLQMTAPGSNTREGPCGSKPNCSAGIGNPDGDGPSFDFFLRRARLMLWGSVTKELSFFIDTDQANWGKNGVWTQQMVVQDAFFSYAFMPEFKIDAGMMLVPLSHHTLEGATSLNALDYHSDLIRFPAGHTFRDTGVQIRGLVANDFIHYRLGVFNGVRTPPYVAPAPGAPPVTPPSAVNNMGLPRVTGQLRANILGSEPDFFLKGIYFAEAPIISVGVGADFQPNATLRASGRRRNYFAGSFDVFVDYPFTADDELIFKANLFYWAVGSSRLTSGAGVNSRPQGAIAGYAEVGYRHAWIEPLAFFEFLQEPKDEAGARSLISPHVGVNFWAMKHTFSVKTDVGYRVQQNRADPPPNTARTPATRDIFWTTQGQLFF